MLAYDDFKHEYEFISDNGIIYSLYEGLTIQKPVDADNSFTSDIIFIVLDNYLEIDTKFINMIYGAGCIEDETIQNNIKDCVDSFEKENPDLITKLQKGAKAE